MGSRQGAQVRSLSDRAASRTHAVDARQPLNRMGHRLPQNTERSRCLGDPDGRNRRLPQDRGRRIKQAGTPRNGSRRSAGTVDDAPRVCSPPGCRRLPSAGVRLWQSSPLGVRRCGVRTCAGVDRSRVPEPTDRSIREPACRLQPGVRCGWNTLWRLKATRWFPLRQGWARGPHDCPNGLFRQRGPVPALTVTAQEDTPGG